MVASEASSVSPLQDWPPITLPFLQKLIDLIEDRGRQSSYQPDMPDAVVIRNQAHLHGMRAIGTHLMRVYQAQHNHEPTEIIGNVGETFAASAAAAGIQLRRDRQKRRRRPQA